MDVIEVLAAHRMQQPLTEWPSGPAWVCTCGERWRGRGEDWRPTQDAHLADAFRPLLAEAGAEALDDAAAAIYNGAGDPEQEFYDHGVSPWLTMRALRLRAAAAGMEKST